MPDYEALLEALFQKDDLLREQRDTEASLAARLESCQRVLVQQDQTMGEQREAHAILAAQLTSSERTITHLEELLLREQQEKAAALEAAQAELASLRECLRLEEEEKAALRVQLAQHRATETPSAPDPSPNPAAPDFVSASLAAPSAVATQPGPAAAVDSADVSAEDHGTLAPPTLSGGASYKTRNRNQARKKRRSREAAEAAAASAAGASVDAPVPEQAWAIKAQSGGGGAGTTGVLCLLPHGSRIVAPTGDAQAAPSHFEHTAGDESVDVESLPCAQGPG